MTLTNIKFLNYKVFLRKYDLSSYKYINDNGPANKYHINLIKKFSKNYDIFFDIGGNYGFYSIANLNYFKKIIYIEPSDNTFNCFKKTIEYNNLSDKIEIHKVFLDLPEKKEKNFFSIFPAILTQLKVILTQLKKVALSINMFRVKIFLYF